MKIGLIDIEPKIVNTAYMQISQYHKQRGDEVGWWSPLEDKQFDYVYCSSLFDFTDKRDVPKRAITGGTGFDISSRLSQAIEACNYDYSLYPACDYSIVWFSRGCNNKCPFCVVPQKEGKIHAVEYKPLNPKSKYIVVQDNSFFDNPEWERAVEWLRKQNQKIEITNINVRTITDSQSSILAALPIKGQVKIAWDNPKQNLVPHIKRLISRISRRKVMCYVLIGYWSTPEEDLYRVETLRDLGVDSMVMPYNKKDIYQKKFANWVNQKAAFKAVSWNDFYTKKRPTSQVWQDYKQCQPIGGKGKNEQAKNN